MSGTLLQVKNLDVKRGGALVCSDVSLRVKRGSVTTLSGSNGAGKSTLLDAIAGVAPADSGEILLAGENVSKLPAFKRARRGIAYVGQGRTVFGSLTVSENIAMIDASSASLDRVFELFPDLVKRRRVRAELLSGGEQQMLKIGRALTTRPKLLMIDELSLGLAEKVVDQLAATVLELSRDGVGILLVEQFKHVTKNVGTDHYRMSGGEVKQKR